MENHIQVNRQFRYEILNPESESSRVLFVLHGYGQLARYFIRKFEVLKDEFLIVAPEGIHRYYLEGSSGRVGASWMTKEDRLIDIEDNIEYLNSLLDRIKLDFNNVSQIHVLGFSQGGATATRWAGTNKFMISSFVLWACVFPPDMENISFNKTNKKYFVLGDNDEYFNSEKQQLQILNFYSSMDYTNCTYPGNHDIHPSFLKELYNKILQ